ncbi:MAG: site-2 protease family protein, partial [Cyanobacteria bacterium SW_7_48_12]
MQANWRFGSLFGIPLYINSSWFLILALVTIFNAGNFNASGAFQGSSLFFGWIAGFVMALLLFGSVLLHELGHSLVAKAQGIPVNSITLFLFGGVAAIGRESNTPGKAFQVAIAGPVVSITLFGLFTVVTPLLSESSATQTLALNLARTNLVLGLFNLIPGLPLDGGQVLKAAIWKLNGDRFVGGRWASRTGQV